MKQEQIDELRQQFTATTVVSSLTLMKLVEAVAELVTDEAEAKAILVEHYPDFFRGWFFPLFGFFMPIEWIEDGAGMLLGGTSPYELYDDLYQRIAGPSEAD